MESREREREREGGERRRMERRASWPGRSCATHIPTALGLAPPPPHSQRRCPPQQQQQQQQYHGGGDPSSFLLGRRQKSQAQHNRRRERNRILAPKATSKPNASTIRELEKYVHKICTRGFGWELNF